MSLPPTAQLLPLVLQRHELLQPRLEHSKALAQLHYERLAGGLQAAGRRGGRQGGVSVMTPYHQQTWAHMLSRTRVQRMQGCGLAGGRGVWLLVQQALQPWLMRPQLLWSTDKAKRECLSAPSGGRNDKETLCPTWLCAWHASRSCTHSPAMVCAPNEALLPLNWWTSASTCDPQAGRNSGRKQSTVAAMSQEDVPNMH